MKWDYLYALYPSGIVLTNDGPVTIEDLNNSDIDSIQITYIKPVRDMVEHQTSYTYYPNGDVEVYKDYNIWPERADMVDGKPLLNAYAQRFYNEFMHKKIDEDCCKMNEEDEDAGFDYSVL